MELVTSLMLTLSPPTFPNSDQNSNPPLSMHCHYQNHQKKNQSLNKKSKKKFPDPLPLASNPNLVFDISPPFNLLPATPTLPDQGLHLP